MPRACIEAEVGMVTRTADSVLFVRPWGERFWIIGTTDTPWKHDREDPAASGADVDYLLKEVNTWLARPLTRADVMGVYAGVRPLVSGRGTSADDAATAALGAGAGSVTDRTPMLGAEGWDALRRQGDRLARRSGLSAPQVEHLLGRYGALVEEVIDLLEADPTLAEPLTGAPHYLEVEIVYAATHEGARTLEDVLARRTHISIETPDRGLSAAEPAAELVGESLGWPPDRRRSEVAAYRSRLEAARRSEHARDDDEAVRAQSPESIRHERCAGSRSSKNCS